MTPRKLAGAVRPRLIHDAHRASRFWSVRIAALSSMLMAALIAFPGVWAQAPAEVRALLPTRLQGLVPLILFLATLAARFVKQKDATRGD